jgi:hypothetical protein
MAAVSGQVSRTPTMDQVYLIRRGSGIGVFTPQFGPRRGYFVGFSQKLSRSFSAEQSRVSLE